MQKELGQQHKKETVPCPNQKKKVHSIVKKKTHTQSNAYQLETVIEIISYTIELKAKGMDGENTQQKQ